MDSPAPPISARACSSWVPGALRFCSVPPPAAAATTSVPISPNLTLAALGSHNDDSEEERAAYLAELIQAIYDARNIVGSYNIVIIVVTLVLALFHWRRVRKDGRKWRARNQQQTQFAAQPCLHRGAPSTITAATGNTNTANGSSSSSDRYRGAVTAGNATSPDFAAKCSHCSMGVDADVDVEREPLLLTDRRNTSSTQSRRARSRLPGISGIWRNSPIARAVSSFLARQPPPAPFVNKTLPSNGTSAFIGTWIALNVFFHLYRLPLRWDFFFIFADRAGYVFIVNLPLLYLLGAKNQPLRLLTGYSYEALNIFHRRVGELMCFEAVVHLVSMVIWQFYLAADWLLASRSPWDYFTHPLILLGFGAFLAYELLFLTSLGSFRQRWYELFLASHVFLQAAGLIFLWLHFYTSQPYVALSLVIFLTDRLVWRLGLNRAEITADLCILQDGETYLLSADWDLPSLTPPQQSRWWCPAFLQRQSIVHGWQPTDHVFVSVPALGPSHALQAHPFTIASAAPGSRHSTEPGQLPIPVHAWFSLLIRAHDGFTADLLRYAQTHSRVSVRLDGPYGSSHALEMLRASDCAVLVAGGSGIAVTFPLIWALLHDPDRQTEDAVEDGKACRERGKQSVHLLWVTHSRSHRSWVPSQELDELVALGLDLAIPEPSAEVGRPDVAAIVDGWIQSAAAEGREVAVVASGPDGLNRTVRNTCANAIGAGLDVRVAVEKFGW
ncbi:hypothetical protein B0T19DRAFT_409226 [Cercophora scortea]|uniref:FAD-binding FR-type domain-containing protein n=1 Tax=Cercophora scortea TaxID=314031 RepID=A0AAE0MLQ5_9PEZI|nr:hypothetical protein B0T19DRAFT_409226 [Cercophora scortea]